MNYYNELRNDQRAEERRQDQNDRNIQKYFDGSLKPSNKKILRKLKEESKRSYDRIQSST